MSFVEIRRAPPARRHSPHRKAIIKAIDGAEDGSHNCSCAIKRVLKSPLGTRGLLVSAENRNSTGHVRLSNKVIDDIRKAKINEEDDILRSLRIIDDPAWFAELRPVAPYDGREKIRFPFTAFTFADVKQHLVCLAKGALGSATQPLDNTTIPSTSLLDFRCQNPDDGRCSPLTPDCMERFYYYHQSIYGRPPDDYVGGEHVLAFVQEEATTGWLRQYHNDEQLRWNKTPWYGFHVRGGASELKDAYVELQYKRVSGADLPLALDCGVDRGVFEVLRKLSPPVEADKEVEETLHLSTELDLQRSTDIGSFPPEAAEEAGSATPCAIWYSQPGHVCRTPPPLAPESPRDRTRRETSYVYLVRLVGFQLPSGMRYNYLQGPKPRTVQLTLLAMGGWVVPPLEERLHIARQQQPKTCRTGVAPSIRLDPGESTSRDDSEPPSRPRPDCALWAIGNASDLLPSVVCEGEDPELWCQVADPTQEDVLWMAWKLLTGTVYRGFRNGVGVGIDRYTEDSKERLRVYADSNPYVSPSNVVFRHSAMLYRAYATAEGQNEQGGEADNQAGAGTAEEEEDGAGKSQQTEGEDASVAGELDGVVEPRSLEQ